MHNVFIYGIQRITAKAVPLKPFGAKTKQFVTLQAKKVQYSYCLGSLRDGENIRLCSKFHRRIKSIWILNSCFFNPTYKNSLEKLQKFLIIWIRCVCFRRLYKAVQTNKKIQVVFFFYFEKREEANHKTFDYLFATGNFEEELKNCFENQFKSFN